MVQITYVQPDGVALIVEVAVGRSVMEGARASGVQGILAECGGGCACATCHVYVDPAWAGRTGSRTPVESEMLDFSDDVRETSRLSCQIAVTDALDGLVVTVAPQQ